jgi:hypothetical protein
MKAIFKKIGNVLHPVGDESFELLQKIKAGDSVTVDIVKPRNYQFHKKWFALLKVAFDHWEPTIPETKWKVIPQKNFDRFRKDVTILAGYYYSTVRLDGDVRIDAKSVSFGSMSHDEFDELYSKTVDVILQRILTKYTREDLDRVVDEVMAFT